MHAPYYKQLHGGICLSQKRGLGNAALFIHVISLPSKLNRIEWGGGWAERKTLAQMGESLGHKYLPYISSIIH